MTLRLAISDVALAARCPRQFVLARSGVPVGGEGARIGTAAHSVLSRFMSRGAAHPALVDALGSPTWSDESLAAATMESMHGLLAEVVVPLAPKSTAAELERLGWVVHRSALFVAALLARARRAGLAGEAAFEKTFVATERPVSISFEEEGVTLAGVCDLLTRDHGNGALVVWDLKTAIPDAVANEQVRLYARALRREGEDAIPALVSARSDALELRRVADDGDEGPPLAWKPGDHRSAAATEASRTRGRVRAGDGDDGALLARVRSLRAWALGETIPPAATEPETCQACSARDACWSRWGRTLSEPAGEPAGAAVESAHREERALEKVLRRYVPVKPIDPGETIRGPSVVRYRVRLQEGEHVRRLESSVRDIQREMGWAVAPVVRNGPDFVSIDAPRTPRKTLSWASFPPGTLRGLEVAIGQAIDGRVVTLDFADPGTPHLLVAGTTGSGKSSLLQALVLSLVERAADASVALVDPKGLDFVAADPRALAVPVITDTAAAAAYLRSLVDEELPRRTALLREQGVANRTELAPGTLPALIVVIDEFADLLAQFARKAEREAFVQDVKRLLQKSRAVGIHLVIATQRPSVDAVPGALKANLTASACLRVQSELESRLVLGEGGGENLLDRGDLLFRDPAGITRAQGFHVDQREFLARLSAAADRASPAA